MDFAENWCSLLELFVSNAGLKLRMFMIDTVLIKNGRVLGHFYTSKEGYICRFGSHEVTRQTIYQRLAALHSLDPQLNPFGYIAVAHYATGVSRLLKRAKLQELMTSLCGPYEFSDTSSVGTQHEQLFCLQAYIVPRHDMRYIASYDVQEGPLCTVLGRRFSARYTNAMDDPRDLVSDPIGDPNDPTGFSSMATAAAMAAANAARPLAAVPGDEPVRASLTTEELLVESQLVALGLLEPRRLKGGEGDGEADADGEEAEGHDMDAEGVASPGASDGITSSMPAPRRVKDDIARLLQALSSFVERAHGQRIVGLVAEFITAGSPLASCGGAAGSLVLMAVHAVQLDPRASRGRLGTFTERWSDYLDGLAPPPAPQPPGRRNQNPSILRSGDASLVMTDRSSGLVVRTTGGSYSNTGIPSLTGALSSYGGVLNPQRQLLTAPSASAGGGAASVAGFTVAASLPSPRVHGGGGSIASSVAASSLTRIYSASTSAAHHRAIAALADPARPGSAPAGVVKVGRHISNSVHSSASNGHYTLRNAMSAARVGGGGNPTTSPGNPDSYNLWLSRDGAPTESMSAKLALEVEALRERLQRQTDIAVRAEAALQHLAVNSRKEAMELRQQIEELRLEVGRLGEAKRNLAGEYDRLRVERLGLQAGRCELSSEVDRLRGELASERETLSKAVRDATAREEHLESQLRTAKDERDDATRQLDGLRRKLEEESGKVSSLAGDLCDYKQLVAQLQAQVRRGRNNKQLLGIPTAMPSTANLANQGMQGTNGNNDANNTARGRNTKDGEESDTETDAGAVPEQTANQGGGRPMPGGGGGNTTNAASSRMGGGGGGGGGYGARRPSNNHHYHHHASPTASSQNHAARTSISPQRPSVSSPSTRTVTLAPPVNATPSPVSGSIVTLPDASSSNGLSTLLAEIRKARLSSTSPQTSVDRPDSGKDSHASAAAAAGSGGAGTSEASPGRHNSTASPTGSVTGAATGALLLTTSNSGKERQGVGLGARKPNYELITAHDLFLMSWTKESLTPHMVECHVLALKMVSEEEMALADIFSFYAHLGQVVWLDSRLTMNEKQFVKLAVETGVAENSIDEMHEVFRKLSDKTEFGSDAAVNHPQPFIYFELFPEAVLRLAALRYEWRPPENLEDAEEELYFASPPFMPPNPRVSQLGDDEYDPPPRPPEDVFLEIVKTYLRDDLMIKARRFKTAGSPRAKFRSQVRTAPAGIWLSSKSLSAGLS